MERWGRTEGPGVGVCCWAGEHRTKGRTEEGAERASSVAGGKWLAERPSSSLVSER